MIPERRRLDSRLWRGFRRQGVACEPQSRIEDLRRLRVESALSGPLPRNAGGRLRRQRIRLHQAIRRIAAEIALRAERQRSDRLVSRRLLSKGRLLPKLILLAEWLRRYLRDRLAVLSTEARDADWLAWLHILPTHERQARLSTVLLPTILLLAILWIRGRERDRGPRARIVRIVVRRIESRREIGILLRILHRSGIRNSCIEAIAWTPQGRRVHGDGLRNAIRVGDAGLPRARKRIERIHVVGSQRAAAREDSGARCSVRRV